MVEQRIRRGKLHRKRKLRTARRIQRIIDGITRQCKTYGNTVRCTVLHTEEVLPVFKHIQLIIQVGRESKVVIGPRQPLSQSQRNAEQFDILVGVDGISIIRRTRIMTVKIIVIAVIIVVVERSTQCGRFTVINREAERIGSFPPEPRFEERHTVRLVITGIGLHAERKRLPIALRNDTFIGFGIEQILDRKIGKFQTQSADNTGLSPTGRQLDLIVGFRFEYIGQIDRTVFIIGFGLHIHRFGIEMPRLHDFPHRTHQFRTIE